ncbi:hypothetical protein LZ30DRAFT_333840 [Colletotrichum cereale]|nr:hypothetical protein LZ30DRAFT_333840 [Colletotrichum cereale]
MSYPLSSSLSYSVSLFLSQVQASLVQSSPASPVEHSWPARWLRLAAPLAGRVSLRGGWLGRVVQLPVCARLSGACRACRACRAREKSRVRLQGESERAGRASGFWIKHVSVSTTIFVGGRGLVLPGIACSWAYPLILSLSQTKQPSNQAARGHPVQSVLVYVRTDICHCSCHPTVRMDILGREDLAVSSSALLLPRRAYVLSHIGQRGAWVSLFCLCWRRSSS